MDDLISRRAAIDALSTPHGILYPIRTVEELPSAQPEITFENLRKYCEKRHLVILTREFYDEMKRTLQSVQPERMTNRQWVDFLSAQFDISRTSAKEMLHGMMRWKKEDNFKKLFNGGKT